MIIMKGLTETTLDDTLNALPTRENGTSRVCPHLRQDRPERLASIDWKLEILLWMIL